MNLPKSILVKSQKQVLKTKLDGENIEATVRYDDECGNGHNTFAITVDSWPIGRTRNSGGASAGQQPEKFAKAFPELEHLLKWHLCSSDGPMHYVGNTQYHATTVKRYQHFVYLQDPVLKKSSLLLGLFSDKELEAVKDRFSDFDLSIESKPTYDSRDANLGFARNSAIWPDATQEELQSEEKLLERLPALMKAFKADIEEFGFTY